MSWNYYLAYFFKKEKKKEYYLAAYAGKNQELSFVL